MDISDNITRAESSGDSKKPNPNSSALGLGQFVKATWLDMIRRYYPDLEGKSDAEILELRKNPVYSREMTRRYAEENEAKLRRAGIPVTPGSTYLMHFAGPSGGIALMKADPNTAVESILSDQAIKANPYLQGKTASWVIAWANKKMADAKSSVAPQPAPWHAQQPIPYLAQTQALDPAFGATSWPPRPSSPKMLSPDAVRPFAGAPRVAPTPFVDGTAQAQQALDNSFPAPGAAPSAFPDRFGTSYSKLAPGVAIPGAEGPTSIGGPNGPAPLMPPAPSRSRVPASDARRLTSIYPKVGPLGRNSPGWRSGPDGLSGLAGSQPNALSFSPVWSMPEALLAPDRRALGDWVQPLPFNQAKLPAQTPGGIPGLLARVGAFDPSHPDDPPAGGLLRLLQDYMRNNPDGSSAS